MSELRLSLVSYIVSCLGLGSVLGTELVLDLGLGLVLDIELVSDLGLSSLSILFIIEYQFFWYFCILSLSLGFYLVWGGIVVRVGLCGLVWFLGS